MFRRDQRTSCSLTFCTGPSMSDSLTKGRFLLKVNDDRCISPVAESCYNKRLCLLR